jgi:hypothetical protein
MIYRDRREPPQIPAARSCSGCRCWSSTRAARLRPCHGAGRGCHRARRCSRRETVMPETICVITLARLPHTRRPRPRTDRVPGWPKLNQMSLYVNRLAGRLLWSMSRCDKGLVEMEAGLRGDPAGGSLRWGTHRGCRPDLRGRARGRDSQVRGSAGDHWLPRAGAVLVSQGRGDLTGAVSCRTGRARAIPAAAAARLPCVLGRLGNSGQGSEVRRGGLLARAKAIPPGGIS